MEEGENSEEEESESEASDDEASDDEASDDEASDDEEIDYEEELPAKARQLRSLLSLRTDGLQAEDEKAHRPIELAVLQRRNLAARPNPHPHPHPNPCPCV